jgi:hypothetical protein
MTAGLWLTEAEIQELCAPLTQPAAQIRFLRSSGLTVTVKPNGRPAVVRSHAEQVLSGQAASAPPSQSGQATIAAPRPNVEGFLKLVGGGRKHGSKKTVQPA